MKTDPEMNAELDSFIAYLEENIIRNRSRIEKRKGTVVCTVKQWGGFLIAERTLLEIADDLKQHNLSESRLLDRLRLYDKTVKWTEADRLKLESKLLNCPFCNASASDPDALEADLLLRCGRLENGIDIEESYVVCSSCWAIGPLCGTPESAVLYWNKRHVEKHKPNAAEKKRIKKLLYPLPVTDDEISDELLPCPFCGASNIIQRGPEEDCSISCCGCLAQIDYDREFDDYALAVDKWNARLGIMVEAEEIKAVGTQLSLLDLMKLAK